MSFDFPPGVQVLERGWLSSNNILLTGADSTALVDSGYATHSPQTLALLENALDGRPLDVLLNTHLHSDHCGGNAALQRRFPRLRTLIPPGQASAVAHWDLSELSYAATGQQCPPFKFDALLRPGASIRLADRDWDIHPAGGHDPHAVLLFEPQHRLLISADALWEKGFGVVFPELEGVDAFEDVGRTLDLIESLAPRQVIPGHGRPFADVASALKIARERLAFFVANPAKHTKHAAKVLLKFKLMELQACSLEELCGWGQNLVYLDRLRHACAPSQTMPEFLTSLLAELAQVGAVIRQGQQIQNGQ